MPNITEYTSPIDKLTPSETGVEATARVAQHAAQIGQREAELARQTAELHRQTGTAIGGAISSAGGLGAQMYTQFVVQPEISNGARLLAQTQADLVDAWNTTAKANPNDPNLARKFNDAVLEPAIEKFQGAFQTEEGQKWAQAETQRFREHMFQKTAADTSTMAGNAAVVNVEHTINSLSQLSASDPTPATMDHAKEVLRSSVEALIASHPNLTADQVSQMRTQYLERGDKAIEQGAIHGLGNRNPDAALDLLHGGYKFDAINGTEEEQFVKNMKTAKRYDDALARQEQTRNAQVASDVAETEFMKKLYSDDPNVRAQATTQSVLNNPDMSREAKERQVRIIERELKPETTAKISERNATRLIKGIWEGNIDMNDLRTARANGEINKTDFFDLQKELLQEETPEGKKINDAKKDFLKGIEPSIDKSVMGIPDPDGKERFYRFQWELGRRMDQYRREGKDPLSLLDPDNPNYMGKPETVRRFVGPMQQRLLDAIRNGGGVGAAPGGRGLTGPGESVTGTEVINQPPGAKTFVPPANWQWSEKLQQYRDPTGKRYDPSGRPVVTVTPGAAPAPTVPLSR